MIVDQTGRPYASTTYEGASQAPRMSNFMAPTIGPNTAIGNSLTSLRGRSRQAIRNNPHAKSGQETYTANMVGKGITPRFNFPGAPDGVKEQVQELWLDSVPEFDWDGNANFYGMEATVAYALFSDGESLGLIRPRNRYADLAVPLQVQLMEADHLDVAYSTTLPSGRKIRMSIEYTKSGKRAAYHLFKDHPGEMFMNGDMGRVRVPAKNITHVFDVTRPGQQRGLPALSSTLVKLHEIDQCVDAELVRRKTTAMFGGFIKQIQEYNPENSNMLGSKKTVSGIDVVALEPGTFPVLNLNEDVVFSQPHDVSGSYIAWMKQQLMDVAQGMGITYDQLTGDLSGVNYSSIRAGLLEFRRALTMKMHKTLIFQFCRPVIQRWLDTAVITGKLIIPDYLQNKRRYYRGITWQSDPWQWIDPYKDMLAEILEIRGGLKNYTQALAARGQDIESFFAEREGELKLVDLYNFVFDTDPRKTTAKGIYQGIGEAEGDKSND
ncbi:MAG: phage portal protein [Desulfobacterium sp.]|nr:phage portal protein [Desulfobacterium sp.]